MRFGELLDALHIGRRKEAKVGDKFDDYHVHAPPRRVATSSRADRSHRRLVLSPSGRSLRTGTRSNHERSERTLSYGRMGGSNNGAGSSWKRTISAPRALSEVRPATEGNVFNAEQQASRRRFYAPNERPQPRIRPVIHLPDTYDGTSYEGAITDGDANAYSPVRQRTEPIIPFDPYDTEQPPSPERALPRRSSKKSRRRIPSAREVGNSNGNNASDTSTPEQQIQIPSRESDIDSEIALPVGPAVPVQHSYVTDAFRDKIPSDAAADASDGFPSSLARQLSSSHSKDVSRELASSPSQEISEVSAPVRRKKGKKKRPPPLITTGAPHGFAAAGLREPPPGPGVGVDMSNPGIHGLPRPMSAPDTSARAASPRNEGVMPRRNSPKKKKKRPPPLVTSGAPHGFASGGLRDPQIPLPNPALPRPNSAPDAYTPYLSPRANGSSNTISPSASVISGVPSLPRKNSSKKGKKSRPPALVTHGSPHGFAAAGLREPTQPIHPNNQQDTPIIVLSSPPGAASSSSPAAEIRQRKGSRGRSGLNHMSANGVNSHTHVGGNSASSTSLILNKVRARSRIVSSQRPSSNAQSQMQSIPQTHINPAETSSPAAMVAKSNSRARISYSSKQSLQRHNTSPTHKTAQKSRTALTDRSSPPKQLPLRPPQLEADLLFEEATSISSFGESETNRTRDIFRNDNHNNSGEVCEEDVFVIGADGVFKGGGFEISKNGMLKSPGNLTRKLSDGKMVDGVPHSSKHLIIVRSLAEFSRGSMLSSRRSNKIDSTIGAGAAGRVSLAVHRPSGRKIAVKRINVFDVQKRMQLLKELETLMCYDSRFLVRSYGAFYDGEGVVHVTLEYMDRGALSDVIELRGKISEDITVHITEHCLKGLEFLHKNHVLHRDFKTSNILMSRRVCRAKLSDFGLARELSDGESKINSFVGTLAYMSPERLNGSEYTYASDVWGLGICVLECLLGHYPFPRPQSYFDYLEAAQSNPATLVTGVSDACVDFIAQCTAADPLKRPTVKSLLQHPWITGSRRDTNIFRAWLQDIPLAHDGLDTTRGYSKAVHKIRRNQRTGAPMRTEGVRKAKERAHDLDTHEGIRIGTRT